MSRLIKLFSKAAPAGNGRQTFERCYGAPTNIDLVWEARDALHQAILSKGGFDYDNDL